jgi:hypothetical protein
VEALPLVRAKGTLVVVPPVLLGQWVAETHRHAPSLVVGIYAGCAAPVLTSPLLKRGRSDLAQTDFAQKDSAQTEGRGSSGGGLSAAAAAPVGDAESLRRLRWAAELCA